MYFVGREKEVSQVQRALERRENLVLMGKYGMGRTSLIRHVARIARDRWRFIFADFSQTPGEICRHLARDLLPERKCKEKGLSYKSIRFRISTMDFTGQRHPVLVLDNIGKLTRPKMDLIRYLSQARRFLFVDIVETFLPSRDLFLLRSWLNPVKSISVSYLNLSKARDFFRHYAEEYYIPWTESDIHNLAKMSGGYPLGIKEIVERNLKRWAEGGIEPSYR